MFGLDARITLLILATISIVVGVYMVQVISGRHVDSLLFEHNKYTTALEAFQEDLETRPHNVLATTTDENAFMALVDETRLTANSQPKWQGPYLRTYYTNQHKSYGIMTLTPRQADHSATCTQALIRARECFYYWSITNVPLQTITALNEETDGIETTPTTNGTTQWSNISSSNATLYLRLGLVAP